MPNIEMKLEGIKKAQRKYSPKVVRKAVSSALNKTIKSARTEASTQIRKTYNIKKKDLDKKTMWISRARPRPGRLRAMIIVRGRSISLTKFNARQLKKGTKVTIIKGKRTMLPSHFIATMPAGHTGVFKRRKESSLPIAQPRMISMASIFAGTRVMPKVKQKINRVMPKIFINELRFFMSKSK